MIKKRKEADIPINQQDANGHTLLHQVLNAFNVYENKLNLELVEAIEVLLSEGADPCALNKYQRMPFSYATYNGFESKLYENMRNLEEKYSKFLLKYCDIKSMILHIEKGLLSFYNLDIDELSIIALEELIKWCDQLIEKGLPKPMDRRCVSMLGNSKISDLKEKCITRIQLLKDYPELEAVLDEFLNPAYEPFIFRSFQHNSELRRIFLHLLEYHSQLNISSSLSNKMLALAEKYQAEAIIFAKWRGAITPLDIEETAIQDRFIKKLNETFIHHNFNRDTYQGRKRGNWSQEPLLKDIRERYSFLTEIQKEKQKHVLDDLTASNLTSKTSANLI